MRKMKLETTKILLLSVVVGVFAPLKISAEEGSFPAGYLQPLRQYYAKETTTEKPLPLNETSLDTSADINKFWEISPANKPKIWFAYYNNTIEFSDAGKDTCVSQIGNTTFEDVDGVWVACKDPDLPECCEVDPYAKYQCHPLLKYDIGMFTFGLRTLTIKFAVFELGLLRLHPGNTGICFDYSPRQDPFSPCEFIPVVDGSSVTGGWQEIQFAFDVGQNTSFYTFQVDMIARFKGDAVFLDRINGTDKLLCGDEECRITTPPPTTTTYGLSSSSELVTSIITSTANSESSDPISTSTGATNPQTSDLSTNPRTPSPTPTLVTGELTTNKGATGGSTTQETIYTQSSTQLPETSTPNMGALRHISFFLYVTLVTIYSCNTILYLL